MSKIIVYGISEDKVWFGRPTLLSWLYCFFHRGGMLTVKPIKGWEEFAYYPDRLHISFEYANITNESFGSNPFGPTPLASVIISEKRRGREWVATKSWQEK